MEEKGLGFTMLKNQLFKIYGSKFKPYPGSNSGQTTVVCVAHTIFFLHVHKDAFILKSQGRKRSFLPPMLYCHLHFCRSRYLFLLKFLLIGGCFDVCSVYKYHPGLYHSVVQRLFRVCSKISSLNSGGKRLQNA